MLLNVLASGLVLLLVGQQSTVNAWWMFAAEPTAAAVKAVATFDLDGVRGSFKFSQKSPTEPTLCEYDLIGLKGNNKLYHVHVRPVPPFKPEAVRNNATALAQLCGDPATGGHHNPFHVTAKLPPKSAPLEKYETGDLSGKHGPLYQLTTPGQVDHYVGSFTDSKLPLSGENSILGRSIVIHKNDGKRWVCASIVEAK